MWWILVYYHPAYLTYMQSTSWEMQGWMKHKMESIFPGEISITSDMQMTPPLWQKVKSTKEPLDESEREEWKVGFKLSIQKPKIMASGPITSWQIVENQWKQWETFIFLAPKSPQMVTVGMKLKDARSLKEKFWWKVLWKWKWSRSVMSDSLRPH